MTVWFSFQQKHHTDPLTGGIHAELSQSVNDLEDSLQRTVDLIINCRGWLDYVVQMDEALL